MLQRFAAATISVLMFSAPGRAQTAQSAPAPRRDISGIWDPANGVGDEASAELARRTCPTMASRNISCLTRLSG